jgi:hypothetical protein
VTPVLPSTPFAAAPPAPAAAAAPESAASPAPDNEALIAGLALAAERLRAQTPVAEEPCAEPAPEPAALSPVEPAAEPAVATVPEPAPEPAASAAETPAVTPAEPEQPARDEPWAPRPGGLVERIGRVFRRRG